MSSNVGPLVELPGLVAGRLPRVGDVGALTNGELTDSLTAIGEARRVLDASAAVLAAEVDRRSARGLGAGGLAQRRGHKDGAGLVEELTGVGRGEAAKLIRVGDLLEAAHSVAPVAATGPLEGPAGAGPGGGDHGEGGGEGASGAAVLSPAPRDLAVLRGLAGSWHTPIGVAVRNGWLSAAQGDRLRGGLGAPRSAEFEARWREAVLELIADCWAARWNRKISAARRSGCAGRSMALRPRPRRGRGMSNGR